MMFRALRTEPMPKYLANTSGPPARALSAHAIPSLDGLRAISFLIVYVSHAGLQSLVPGGFGVTVFFFLSGYLITTLLRLELEQHGTIRMRDFYLRRALRIWPPFYAVLLLAVIGVLVNVVPGRLAAMPLLAQAFHFNNYWTIAHGVDGIPAGAGVYWSLAIEEHFYLLFPWIFLALMRGPSRPRTRAMVLWGLCAAVLAWRCWLVLAQHAPEDRTYMGSDTRFDSLLFGCALALHCNPGIDAARGDGRWLKFVWLPLGIATLVFTFVYRAPAFRETLRYTLQGVALIPVFVAAIRHSEWGPMRLLNHPIARFLGVLSYSLYLLHHVVLAALHHRTTWPAPVQGVVGLGVSIAIAWGIHVALERPAARVRRRLSRAVVRRAEG
ncbi:MAG: acyltransferase, partial [Candidatus Eisenbacteria bacterium]|nr:acyltransferase [Candidatus Eisenbacteria bacterium]